MAGNPADAVRARLERALSEPSLPANARDYGANLARRLGAPVRVAILGLPRSGKSQLLNMLVGRRMFAEGSRLPSVEITAGATWRTTVTRADGTTHTFDGLVLEGPELARARMLALEAPLNILDRISLLEVVADASVESQRRALQLGARRAEILVWCTQEFSEFERLLWRSVPGGMKDHAFLALTKADELQSAGVLSQQLASLTVALAEEFCAILPVATLRALAALGDGSAVDEAAFAASGGRALRAAVLKHVEQGRRADIDNALLFLRRYEKATGGGDAAAAATTAREAGRGGPQASSGARKRCAAVEKALDHLRERAALLAQLAPDAGRDRYAQFLSSCAETTERLGEMIAAPADAPASAALQELMAEASEMMLLLQVEKGAGPAADAATLLLQVRRELEDALEG